MIKNFLITGGVKLTGEVTPIPNKNAILSALCAPILTNETITFHNVPKSSDVEKMLKMLELMGAEVDSTDFSTIKVNCRNLTRYKVDSDLGNQIRASLLFAGPLLARFGIAEIPVPGGCVLGKRSIAAHIDFFKRAGVDTEFFDGYVRFTAPKNPKTKYEVWPLEASVTATENLILYAAGIDTCINMNDAACEPHVTQLLKMLKEMGADIEGIGSNKLEIKGRKILLGTEFEPHPDFVDVAGYIVAAALTDGNITIKGANNYDEIGVLLSHLELFNINIKQSGKDLIVTRGGDLQIDTLNSGFPLAGDDLPKLAPRPWPGFPVDVIPVIVTLACKTKGRMLIQNWMYETGLDFVSELNQIGAEIFLCDSNKVIVTGPVEFKGGVLTSPNIIQACKALFLAALCDPVVTKFKGAEVLRRRYPQIFESYQKLGAKIETIEEEETA